MFIDTFAETWLDELHVRGEELAPSSRLFLLVDGVFVPGLHKLLGKDRKAILFESLPGCSEEAIDVAPFLVPFESGDRKLAALLRRCNRWPMVSLIETTETLKKLTDRLAAWCVVEADGQRFNFRFPDTRRLPAIFQALNPAQRALMAGPAVRWSYVSRTGNWTDLALAGSDADIADHPVVDEHQFAMLVDESRGDELLVVLRDRGHDPYRYPSKSHALVTIALRAATAAGLDSDDTVEWCKWFWQNYQLLDVSAAESKLAAWRNTIS
jgi:hypothetical protein